MAIFAECINERYPLVIGDNLSAIYTLFATKTEHSYCAVTGKRWEIGICKFVFFINSLEVSYGLSIGTNISDLE